MKSLITFIFLFLSTEILQAVTVEELRIAYVGDDPSYKTAIAEANMQLDLYIRLHLQDYIDKQDDFFKRILEHDTLLIT